MLPAAHRMRRSVDFQRTVRFGVRAGSTHLVVHLAVDPQGSELAQVGFVVPKSVGHAVERNLVKRRLRAVMTEYVRGLPAHARVVVRALPPAHSAAWNQLQADLDDGIARAVQRLRRQGLA